MSLLSQIKVAIRPCGRTMFKKLCQLYPEALFVVIDRSNRPSVKNMAPIEHGGESNRNGVSFQDHVALGFCLDMLTDDEIVEVACETHDDVTIYRSQLGTDTVEFVQVKNTACFWGARHLTEKKSTSKNPTSIIEKSLAQDRGKEQPTFRIVTSHPHNSELKPLALTIDSAERKGHKGFQPLRAEIHRRMKSNTSGRVDEIEYWLDHSFLQFRASAERENEIKLDVIITSLDGTMHYQNRREIYTKLLQQVFEAGKSNGGSRGNKSFTQKELAEWLLAEIERSKRSPEAPSGDRGLIAKLEKASLASLTRMACNRKLEYLSAMRAPAYLQIRDQEAAAKETESALKFLLLKLANAHLPDDGPSFYQECLEQLKTIESNYAARSNGGSLPLSFFEGCMFDITHRCEHRFRKDP